MEGALCISPNKKRGMLRVVQDLQHASQDKIRYSTIAMENYVSHEKGP